MKNNFPLIFIFIILLGSLLGCKPVKTQSKSSGSKIRSLNLPAEVNTATLIKNLQKNGFTLIEGKTFKEVTSSNVVPSNNYGVLVTLIDSTVKEPIKFVVGIASDTIICYESYKVSGDEDIEIWKTHSQKRVDLIKKLTHIIK